MRTSPIEFSSISQELAKKYQHIHAQDIVDFILSPEMQGCMDMKWTTISV